MSTSGNRVGRNHPCPCGSGKKYKRCCLRKEGSGKVALDELESRNPRLAEAIAVSLSPSGEDKRQGVELWDRIVQETAPVSGGYLWALINKAQCYKNLGEHRKALELFDTITEDLNASSDFRLHIWSRAIASVSCSELGRTKEALRLADDALSLLKHVPVEPEFEGSVLLEVGKVYRKSGEAKKAKVTWERAASLFSRDAQWKSSYTRALSNLALLRLDDPDEAEQAKGVEEMEQAYRMKEVLGDLEGLANNYGNLGMYYWRKKRYERAIAYLRKDLSISRHVGDSAGLLSTLNNLAIIYGHAKQLKPARKVLGEAKDLAERIDNPHFKALTEQHRRYIEGIGKECGLNKEGVGPRAPCACGSGKPYEDCCGRADHEPREAPYRFSGISEEVGEIYRELKKAGKTASLLDLILRESEQVRRRLGFNEIESHDGWLLWREAADMANLHLSSAEALAESARAEPDSLAHPLGCILLSVCALEAFINQTAYFAAKVAGQQGTRPLKLPEKLRLDHKEYQRGTELTQKWHDLGKALCGTSWPPEPTWTHFKNLVCIRNELVHFKLPEFEQIIPPPKSEHPIVLQLPLGVEKRDHRRAWPFRILTAGAATWAYEVANSLMAELRRGYRAELEGKAPTPTP